MHTIADDVQNYIDVMKKRRNCDPLIRSVNTIDTLSIAEKAKLFIRVVELEKTGSHVAEACMQFLFAMGIWPYDYFYVRDVIEKSTLPTMILNEYVNTLLLRYFDVNDWLSLKEEHRKSVMEYPEFVDFIKLELFKMYSTKSTQLCKLVMSNRDVLPGGLQDIVSFMRESADSIESVTLEDEQDDMQNDEFSEFKQITRFTEEHRTDKKELEYTSGYLRLETPMPYAQWGVDGSLEWDKVLLSEYPWMHRIIGHIKSEMNAATWSGKTAIRISPILIAGHPGMGKTSFIKRMAELIGVPLKSIQLAGSSDNRALEGTARGWSSSQPSILARFLRDTMIANTMIILDELDKVSESTGNGNISSTLISLLEPVTSSCMYDECLLSTMDYSSLQWVGTANKLSDVKPTLLSRMRVEKIDRLRVEDFDQVWHSVLRNVLSCKGIHVDSFPSIDDKIKNKIYSEYKKNIHTISIRNINRMMHDIVNMEIEYSVKNSKRVTH